MVGMDEDERTRTIFGNGQFTFYLALLSRKELSGISLGRHWAVALLHEKGNIVVHKRNFELGDSMNLCGLSLDNKQSIDPMQLRITSWAPSQFVSYRGIVFSETVSLDFDTLREIAWYLYADDLHKTENCQEFAIRLLQRLGVQMTGWLQTASCFNRSGNLIAIPIREKKSLFNPVKLLSLGVLHVVSNGHWDSCTVHFNRLLRDLSQTWEGLPAPSDTALCCVCLDAPREYACVPCGHLCLCEKDKIQAVSETDYHCPMCRRVVSSFMRIYS